jgi:putative membrane protein
MMGWWHGFGWRPGFGPVWGSAGAMLTLLFWGVILALAFLAIRAFVRSQHRVSTAYGGPDSAPAVPANDGGLAVLKERYARGEITRTEYEEIRHVLQV